MTSVRKTIDWSRIFPFRKADPDLKIKVSLFCDVIFTFCPMNSYKKCIILMLYYFSANYLQEEKYIASAM